MKAVVLPEVGEKLVVDSLPDPGPEPNELVIKIRACGICGTDLHMSENTNPDIGWRVLEPGCVMGHEFSGEVVEIGHNLTNQWELGERVTALPWIGCGECPLCLSGRGFRCKMVKMRASAELPGAYAEYCRIGGHEAFRLPNNVTFEQAALVEPCAVGLNAVRRANLKPGDTVLIIGAGPVGLSVALWCRFFGAQEILVSDLVFERAKSSLKFGATNIIDASESEATGKVEEILGERPKVVFDCVGLPGSLQISIDYASMDGRVVVAGLCMAADSLLPTKALTKELDIIFAFIYLQKDFSTVLDLLGSNRFDCSNMVSDRIDINNFPDAFEDLKTPKQQLKVMLEFD